MGGDSVREEGKKAENKPGPGFEPPSERPQTPDFSHPIMTHRNGDKCIWVEGYGWFVPFDVGGEGVHCENDEHDEIEEPLINDILGQLMSGHEKALMDDIVGVWKGFQEMVGHHEQARAADLHEACFHIHALQNMVISQAGRRAFPKELRMLGEVGDWEKNGDTKQPGESTPDQSG